MTDVIVKIQPSFGRRIFGIAILCLAALIMLNYAFGDKAQSIVLRVFLLLFAVVFLWHAQTNLRFADAALILKRDGLFDNHGELICNLSNINRIDRGWISFKPSNGLLIRMHRPMPLKWVPGLYWRFGKNLGVGGMVSPVLTKEMSDKLLLLMQEKVHDIELI